MQFSSKSRFGGDVISILSALGGLRIGDMIIQLIMFIILIALTAGIIALVVAIFKKRDNQLDRIEEKLDKLMSEQEKLK